MAAKKKTKTGKQVKPAPILSKSAARPKDETPVPLAPATAPAKATSAPPRRTLTLPLTKWAAATKGAWTGFLGRFRKRKGPVQPANAAGTSESPGASTPPVALKQKEGFFDRFKLGQLFQKKAEKQVDRQHVMDPMEIERARRMMRKTEERRKRQERKSQLYQRRKLSELLLKAGYRTDAEKMHRFVLWFSIFLTFAATAVSLVSAILGGKPVSEMLLFYLFLWTVVFAFFFLFSWMVIYVYLDMRIYKRTKELEEVLPDFLQLASANISAGMPIDRALWFAVRPNFGILAKEIEEVAKATLAGEELRDSLLKFTDKYDSLVLKRSISILLEGIDAGGEIAELLDKIAQNIEETKIMKKEMSASVMTYAIFITFASVVMAPILFALATQLLHIIIGITSTLDLSAMSSSFFTINLSSSPETVTNFTRFCLLMLIVSSTMSAAIVSVIRNGNVKDGVRNIPIFIVVSLTIYFLASWALGYLLGGIV